MNAPSRDAIGWAYAVASGLIQNFPYFNRETRRAHLRLFLTQWVWIASVAIVIILDWPRPKPPAESNFILTLLDELVFFWDGRGFVIIAILSFAAAFLTNIEFFRQLYRIKKVKPAAVHLITLIFGVGYFPGIMSLFRAIFLGTIISHVIAGLAGFTGYAYFVVSEGKIKDESKDKPVAKAGGPAFVIVYTDTAVVLERDGSFTRVKGPGFVFLERHETIREAVDLRPQVREMKDVQALTKDGIPISFRVEVEFMIQPPQKSQAPTQSQEQTPPSRELVPLSPHEPPPQGGEDEVIEGQVVEGQNPTQPSNPRIQRIKALFRKIRNGTKKSKEDTDLRTPYLFEDRAVRRAVYNKSVVRNGNAQDPFPWKDLIMHRARFELRRLVNFYTLDRLIEPEDADSQEPLAFAETPCREIQTLLRDRLNRFVPRRPISGDESPVLCATDLGVKVLRVTLGHLRIDSDFEQAKDKITKLRIESWKAEWLKRSTVRQAQGEAEDLRLKEIARAEAQEQILRAIARGLETTDAANPAKIKNILALRMIEAMEQMTLDPWASTFIPDETLKTLRKLRALYL